MDEVTVTLPRRQWEILGFILMKVLDEGGMYREDERVVRDLERAISDQVNRVEESEDA